MSTKLWVTNNYYKKGNVKGNNVNNVYEAAINIVKEVQNQTDCQFDQIGESLSAVTWQPTRKRSAH